MSIDFKHGYPCVNMDDLYCIRLEDKNENADCIWNPLWCYRKHF